MSHIAIIGATGRAGGRLLEEALRRGHTVTAIARKASEKLSGRANVKAVDVDALDGPALEKALAGHDAVFSAAHFATVPPAAIIEPVKRAGVKRLLVVGGAGSLFAAPGLKVIETPNFPDAYRAEATAGGVSSMRCAARRNSTGPSCRPPPNSSKASAPASSASARTTCS